MGNEYLRMIEYSLKRIKELSEKLALQKLYYDCGSEDIEHWLETHSNIIIGCAKEIDKIESKNNERIRKHFSQFN